jgi:hypothetical protein
MLKNGQLPPEFMKFDTETKKNMLSSKVTKAETIDRFQDGRRHVENSSACYKVGIYHPITMKIGTQTKKSIVSSKVTKAAVQPTTTFQCRNATIRLVGSACRDSLPEDKLSPELNIFNFVLLVESERFFSLILITLFSCFLERRQKNQIGC